MLIGLGIIGEIFTIYKSKKITMSSYDDAILEISERGYKLDFYKYLELNEGKEQIEINIGEISIMTLATSLIPGLNILFALNRRKKIINNFLKDESIKKSLIELTDEEKKIYSNLDNKLSKFSYTLFNMTKKYDEEVFLDFDNDINPDIYSYDFGKQKIEGDILLPLSYSFDDVKRINDSSSGLFKVGKIDDINVAIVGIDDNEKMFKRLTFKRDNYNEVYNFTEMNEEEAKDERFVIYPYKEKEYEDVIDNILEERRNQSDIKVKKLLLTNREVNVWKD